MNDPRKTDCEGLDPETDECADGDNDCDCTDEPCTCDDYYEPTEYDEWMDFDPDC